MTNVVIQQYSRKLLVMDILMSEICWTHKKWNKIASDITEACNTDTTPIQPHRNSNKHRTQNSMTNVVIQQNSRKLLMMDICWTQKKWNKIASDIKLVFYSSTITMVRGPRNIRFINTCFPAFYLMGCLLKPLNIVQHLHCVVHHYWHRASPTCFNTECHHQESLQQRCTSRHANLSSVPLIRNNKNLNMLKYTKLMTIN